MGDILTLHEAAKISGYNQDYLSALIRKGEIEGVRIGRNWCIRPQELNNFLNKKQVEVGSGKIVNSRKSILNFSQLLLMLAFVLFFAFGGLLYFSKNNKNEATNQSAKPNVYEIKTVYTDNASEISGQPSSTFLRTDNTAPNK